MSTRRSSRHVPPPQPLVSHSTLTFIGHWRGQLLITVVVLFVGFIYFIIREPIERWRRRRRERFSTRARSALLALEEKRREREEKEKEREDACATAGGGSSAGASGERGREKKKDAKKRKGSLLKVSAVGDAAGMLSASASASGTSSIEGSPAPGSAVLRNRVDRGGASASAPGSNAAATATPASTAGLSPTAALISPDTPTSRPRNKARAVSSHAQAQLKPSPQTPEIRLRASADEPPSSGRSTGGRGTSVVSHGSSAKLAQIIATPPTPALRLPPDADAELEPWLVPLPASPYAGPSRLSAPASISDSISLDGRSEADSTDTRADDELDAKRSSASGGFSIFPEDGYLPPSALAQASGKKKRRAKKGGNAAQGIGEVASGGTARVNGISGSSTSGSQFGSPGSAYSPLSPTGRSNRLRSTSTPLSLALISESSPLTSPSHTFPSPRNGPLTPTASPARPTHSRSHSRKTSLGGRPANMDLEDLLLERERTIDVLRAEIGLAKAEEAKSREEAERAKRGEESVREEVDRVRRAGGKVEIELKRREAELRYRLAQANDLMSAQGARLGMIEQLLASAGLPLPPPSPMPPFHHTNSSHRLHSVPSSPMPLTAGPSPYPLGYPSPMSRGGVNGSARVMASPMIPYPSPGAFAGAGQVQGGMLHPYFAQGYGHGQMSASSSGSGSGGGLNGHSHGPYQPLSPSPFRRPSSTSATTEADPLAGPLTPGIMGYSDLGIGRPGLNGSAPGTEDEAASMSDGVGVGIGGEIDPERRASIAVSVLKKKQSVAALAGESVAEGQEGKAEEAETSASVEGLGMGEMKEIPSSFTGLDDVTTDNQGDIAGPADGDVDIEVEYDHSSSSSSHRTSPSPRRMLVTPGAPDICPPRENGANAGIEPLILIRNGRGSRSSSGSGRGRLELLADDNTHSGLKLHYTSDHSSLPVSTGVQEEQSAGQRQEDYAPTFASLAHTPEQLQEIARMREVALRRYSIERRASGMSAGSHGGA